MDNFVGFAFGVSMLTIAFVTVYAVVSCPL